MTSGQVEFPTDVPIMMTQTLRMVRIHPIGILIAAASCLLLGCNTKKNEETSLSVEDKANVWMMDLEAAKTVAASEGKDLLIEFTGSDWCAPCIQFEREVLSQADFLEAALPHFVLVKLDFPKDPSLTSPEIQKQNDGLYELYQIEGFPSVILADANGKPYADVEEYDVKLKDYLVILEKDRQKRVKRDEAIASADGLAGIEKAKMLHEGLKSTELKFGVITAFYEDILKTIAANDSDDEIGIARKTRAYDRMIRFMQETDEVTATGDFEGVLPKIDEALTFDQFAPEDIQQLLLIRAITYGQLERHDEAIKALDDAIEAMPDASIIPDIERLRGDFILARDALAEED